MTSPTITPTSRPAWSFSADPDAVFSLTDIQELAQQCAYSWTVETRYHGPTNFKGSRISVAFVGSRKGRKTYWYRHALSATENHLAAAVQWMQQLSSLNGAPSYALVAKASMEDGYVFTFR
jgi:hypothetical protein